MRILMLAQFYAPVVGGEERHVQDLSIELVKRGHDVAVVTLYHREAPEFEVDQGVRVYRVKSTMQRAGWLYSQAERSHAPPFPDPELVRALDRIVCQERPDIIHAHNWLVYSFLPLKHRTSAGLVLSLHDYSLHCVQKRLMHPEGLCNGPRLAKCLTCAGKHYGAVKGVVTTLSHMVMNPGIRAAVDMFLPVSQAAAAGNGLEMMGVPFRIIPNFVPDSTGSLDGDHDGIGDYVAQLPEDKYLLFVGDLSRDKGVNVLIDAYKGLENAPPLVLIGRQRPDTPTALPDKCVALGRWPHNAVMEAWRRSSVALVPSVCRETFGIVVIEAMSMGRPVIASRTGGVTDIIIDGQTGFLVPPGEPRALREAMKCLVADTDLRERMGIAAKRRAADFRASAILPLIEAVYRDVMRARRVYAA